LGRVVFLAITAGCFIYLYSRLNGAAMREGLSLIAYMSQVFANVQWLAWLALMMTYSGFYLAIDTLVVTKALNWFVATTRYRDILPIRASAYIISIFNEQIGKGAMAWMGSRLRDAVHHVLRSFLSLSLGYHRLHCQQRRPAQRIFSHPVHCGGSRSAIYRVVSLLSGHALA
jgi:hypothetical protein